jgi:hypothetical protein
VDNASLVGTQFYASIIRKIKKFLVEAISNVVSVAFKFMCRGELESKEAKEYASKNIMLNVHSIYRQTFKALEGNELLRGKAAE